MEKDDKRMAWFPAPYLENIEDDNDENQDDADETFERGKRPQMNVIKMLRESTVNVYLPLSGMRYTATKSYKATNDDEINVPIGAVVQVLEKSDNGWWLVRYVSS